MRQNAIVLTVLVTGQVSFFYGLEALPGTLVDWSSEMRLGVAIVAFLLLGALGFLLFRGRVRLRLLWVAAMAALPFLIGHVILWREDDGYRGSAFLVMFAAVVFMLLGALFASAMSSKVNNQGQTTDKS